MPKAYFPTAVTFNASAWQSSSIMGPAVGGFLYALGPSVVFGMSTLCFAAASLLISTVTAPAQAEGAKRERPTLDTLFAGVRFIRSRPVILGAISLDLFAVLLGGAVALLPIYARDILHTGPWGLGLLRSMPAAGGHLLDAAAGLVSHPQTGPGCACSRPSPCSGWRRSSSASPPTSCSRWRRSSSSASVDMVSVVVRQTLVQLETPDEMRGRVSAVNSVFIGASNELGEFESGVLAAAIGPVGAVVLGGIGTVVVAGLWIRLFPALWKRDTLT